MVPKRIDIVTNLTTSKQCPLNCSYCVMDYDKNMELDVISLKSNKLIDRIADLVNYLIQDGYTIDMSQTNGEPLLNYSKIEHIIHRLNNTSGLTYDVLSSFAFDEKNNYSSVIKHAKKYIDLFTSHDIEYTFRWSVHIEYFKDVKHIIEHYAMLKDVLGPVIQPIVMLNRPSDVVKYKALKYVEPKTIYHLVLTSEGTVTLLDKLTESQLSLLRSSDDYVRGRHIIDRLLNDDFSFTGTPCHLPLLLNIVEDGTAFSCPNAYHNFYDDDVNVIGNILTLTNKQIINLFTPIKSCPYKQCNVCASDVSLL